MVFEVVIFLNFVCGVVKILVLLWYNCEDDKLYDGVYVGVIVVIGR